MTEYKKFDSQSDYNNKYARLTKDAEVKTFGDGKESVEITFVDESRVESDASMWISAKATDRQAAAVKFLKKGDVVNVTGHITMRKYGDNQEKVAFQIRFAQIEMSPTLRGELKTRGFTPTAGGAPPARPASKPTTTKAAPPKSNRAPIDIPDDDVPF